MMEDVDRISKYISHVRGISTLELGNSAYFLMYRDALALFPSLLLRACQVQRFFRYNRISEAIARRRHRQCR